MALHRRYSHAVATILLTSHYMADVEALCPRVIVIHHGTLLYDGDLPGLVRRFSPLKTIASRNVRPLFVNREITLCGEPSADGKSAKLWAQDDTGALALSAEATFV